MRPQPGLRRCGHGCRGREVHGRRHGRQARRSPRARARRALRLHAGIPGDAGAARAAPRDLRLARGPAGDGGLGRPGPAPADHEPAARLAHASRSKPTTPRWRWRSSSAMQSEAQPDPARDRLEPACRCRTASCSPSASRTTPKFRGDAGDDARHRGTPRRCHRVPRERHRGLHALSHRRPPAERGDRRGDRRLGRRRTRRPRSSRATRFASSARAPPSCSSIRAATARSSPRTSSGAQDCSVVVAQDLDEALAALDQDIYDIVLVDTSLAGPRAATTRRRCCARASRATPTRPSSSP